MGMTFDSTCAAYKWILELNSKANRRRENRLSRYTLLRPLPMHEVTTLLSPKLNRREPDN